MRGFRDLRTAWAKDYAHLEVCRLGVRSTRTVAASRISWPTEHPLLEAVMLDAATPPSLDTYAAHIEELATEDGEEEVVEEDVEEDVEVSEGDEE